MPKKKKSGLTDFFINKKALLLAASAAAVMSVALIVAFLTDSELAVNTFTIGSVDIELNEAGWESGQNVNADLIVPNAVIEKAPTITNTGDDDAVVYLRVGVPKYGTPAVDLYALYSGDTKLTLTEGQKVTDGSDWFLVDILSDGSYLFGYEKRLKNGEGVDVVTTAPFNNVRVSEDITRADIADIKAEKGATNISVKAYAVQTNNLPDIENANTLAKYTAEQLKSIWPLLGAD